MRIALLHPTYWPEVRRGSERLIHDLGVALSGRGHEVTLLTTHGAARSITIEDEIRVDRARRLPQKGPLRWYEHHITAIPPAITRLVRGHFDVAHAFFPVESWAALAARRLGGPPVVSTLHGIPDREYLVKRRYRLEMLDRAAREAAEVSVLSEAASAEFERYFGRRPVVLPGGIAGSSFSRAATPADQPTILCAASLGDPRKRGPLLLEAFDRLRAEMPEARLQVVRTPDPVLSTGRVELPEGAVWVDGDDTSALADLYSRATVSVLPSVDEAFGLVLIESMAAGTPVVAARSGACPEIVDDGVSGVLFEPDDPASLADALKRGLALAETGVRDACLSSAAQWDWSTVADRYEEVYQRVA